MMIKHIGDKLSKEEEGHCFEWIMDIDVYYINPEGSSNPLILKKEEILLYLSELDTNEPMIIEKKKMNYLEFMDLKEHEGF